MPWKEVTKMLLRKQFVMFAINENANHSELCRRFGISRKTGYKWLGRYSAKGISALADKSQRPKTSPNKTPARIEQAIIELRIQHPSWGGRKIRRRLLDLGHAQVPAASTVSTILKRHGLIKTEESPKHCAWQRFEAEAPNDLWQMDYKGYFQSNQGPCHPLTILDDHSRFSLGLQACANQKAETVEQWLSNAFGLYGLPKRILFDNGSPWGDRGGQPYTKLTVWLMRQGIVVTHSRPYHPQTLGKDERFHRTLKAEVLQYCQNLSMEQCQRRFDFWRDIYNWQRPHEALDMNVPGSRYTPSKRSFKQKLPAIEYGPQDQVRKVTDGGIIYYKGKEYRVSKAFVGQSVALRATNCDGLLEVVFCNQKIAYLDIRTHKTVTAKVLPMSMNSCNP